MSLLAAALDVAATVPPAYSDPAPNRWLLRVPLTLAVLGVAVYVYVLMRRGWKARTARQSTLPVLAEPVAGAVDLLPEQPGLYVGSTVAGDWLDRVTARGLGRRGRGVLALTDAGLEIHRDGEEPFLVPGPSVRAARVDARLAGKVAGPGGLLVVTWEHGGTLVDTGFRCDDRDLHPVLVRSLDHLRTSPRQPGSTQPRQETS